jgi:uncharacterized peroxidase-related enzyme
MSSRLNTIPMGEATGEIKELYGAIQEKLGTVPNIFQGMAASPVLLKAYLQLDDLIAAGTLSGPEQDIVRLVASQYNDCQYCLAAHTKTAGAQGLSEDEILAVRRGAPKDAKQAALVTFVQRILDTKGFVEDADLQAFRDAGYDDAQVCEVITIIGQKMMSNFFNHVHDTELDFPAAQDL